MKTPAQRLAWALAACERSQVRMTAVRSAILAFLASQRLPVSLELIAQAEGVCHRCDPTTVYRTLMMFQDSGLIRCVGMPGKTRHVVLSVPGDASHFLICERCGAVEELALSDGTLSAVRRLATERGFADAQQFLEVHGRCATCEKAARKATAISKLLPRYCSL